MQLSGEEENTKCKNILCLDLNFHLSVQAGVEREKQIDTLGCYTENTKPITTIPIFSYTTFCSIELCPLKYYTLYFMA
jgi:hypothetical protein